jgi:SAM-dependent MidA family methyltransferase
VGYHVDGREANPASLEGLLKERIAREGLITYEAFVETVLFDDRFGYYRAGKEERKDYFTSPEIHAAFGRTIGGYLEAFRAQAGLPSFSVIELGGASGRLARDILSSLTVAPDRYTIVENGAPREEGLIRWVSGVDHVESHSGMTFIVANEFFDALPFHRIINKAGILEEIYVGYDAGFFEEPGPLSGDAASFLTRHPVHLPHGMTTEIATYASPLLDRLSGAVDQGCLLLFDYGYHHSDIVGGGFPEGSVMAYRAGSTRASIFENLGAADITHHVNFDHLASMFEDHGWRKEGEIAQYRFLFNAGILDELVRLSEAERLSAKWLINAEGLGSMISVLGFTRGLSVRMPGFGSRT